MKHLCITLLFLFTQLAYSQWYRLNINFPDFLFDVYFVNNSTGYICGMQYVFKTTNGGYNWSPVLQFYPHYFNALAFLNADTGFVVGPGTLSINRLHKTTNGGVNWSGYQNIQHELRNIQLIDSVTGFVVGNYTNSDGRAYRTTDCGATWQQLPPFFMAGIMYLSLYFFDINTGYIGTKNIYGHGGPIIRTTDGGINWYYWYVAAGYSGVTAISFVNRDTGYACDDFGLIWKTTTGGDYWSIIHMTPSALYDLKTLKDETIYSVGHYGVIYRSTDRGLSWETQQSGTTVNLYQIFFIGSDTGYIVGNNGVILKTTNGGAIAVEPISSEIPREFKLYQNYPNPFNPVTKIKFDIPAPLSPPKGGMQTVQLDVYDILGRKVESLVPPLRGGQVGFRPGTYEISWVASKYPSGVYFCRLQAGQYTDTKKMILLK